MSFTHDSTTDEGMLRTLISDTDSTDYNFEDAELTATLDLNSDDLWRTAADLARSLAAKYAKAVQKLGLGKKDIDIDNSKRSQYYLDLANTFDKRSGGDLIEYMDSANIVFDPYGNDRSEYVGD